MIQPVAPSRPLFWARDVDQLFKSVGDAAAFVGRFFGSVLRPPFEGREIVRHCYEVGVRTLPLITLTGLVVGIVFTKQSRPSLASFGASSWLPSIIAIALVRALAPLVTALICAGRVGSNIGAELGSMRVTEQIDAMEVQAVDPFKFLVVTRVVAMTLTLPVLTAYCASIGLLGSYFDVHREELTSWPSFVNDAFAEISFLDLGSALVKSIVFGFTVGITATYKGFFASKGTRGVGLAANTSVVVAMFLIFVEEMVIVQVISWIRAF
jgi:phospholipid/cholesterol/gamma-HCH transport system permease protein